MASDNHKTTKTLTIQEVAKLLRIHRSTVSRYAKSGEIKSYVIGNRRLFKEDDVWTFFDNQASSECVFGIGKECSPFPLRRI